MEFIIWNLNETGKPHMYATKKPLVKKQTARDYKVDMEEWLSVGKNHTKSGDYYLHREIESEEWFIDLDMIELLELLETCPSVSIKKYHDNNDYWMIILDRS